MKTNICIVVNPGHAFDTSGKCSPDGRFREYQFNREVSAIVVDKLIELGFAVSEAAAANEKQSLSFPVQRCNTICGKYGKNNVIFVSIHANAAGNGSEWKSARGWSIYTTPGITESDTLATHIYNAAKKYLPSTQKLRADNSDGDPDWESNFYVLRNTKCPAVLIECGFMDNREDLVYMESSEGKNTYATIIVQGILSYLSK